MSEDGRVDEVQGEAQAILGSLVEQRDLEAKAELKRVRKALRKASPAHEKAVELINRRLTEWVRGPKDQSTFARDVMTILNDLKLRVHA